MKVGAAEIFVFDSAEWRVQAWMDRGAFWVAMLERCRGCDDPECLSGKLVHLHATTLS